MCNTNNTELIRQQLWCDIVTSNNGELTFDKVLADADKVVAEFDKRFNTKLSCQGSGKSKSSIGEILDFRYDDEVEKIENLDYILDKRTLRELYFGENDFYDVSRVADVNENLTYWAGRSKKGINILVKCKRNDSKR